ncbi:anoctamin-5-like isoform X2 [Atheta coriaria]|uniref:anoctamin-5-like isoform X2 n=1 Tax=Dalotia coriaria TaxID=877792 RepID=UPI0031F33FD8
MQNADNNGTTPEPVFKGEIYTRRNYFEDGRRKIDFVLVSSIIKLPSELDTLTFFMTELIKSGIQYEISPGDASPNLVFIKLHCPRHVLEEYANYQHFIFDYKNPRILRRRNRFFPWSIFHNVTTEIRTDDPSYNRAFGSLSSNKARHITSWERSLLVHKMLMRTKFSEIKNEEGINKLIALNILKDAYATHDGPIEWHQKGPLTDRQLLHKYWANIMVFFKHQPIPLIFKYFGPEVAFYFAFVDFYTKMLVVPAILGVLLLIFNAISRDYFDTARVTDICESKQNLCTLCFHKRNCKFAPIKSYCIGAYVLPIFDNIGGGIFAVFMGFWSIAFLEMWKRQEYMLKYRWNLINVESDTAYRIEFLKTAKHTHVSHVSGEKEYYTPINLKIINSIRTLGGLSLMFAVVLLLILLNTLYRVEMTKVITRSSLETLKRHKAFFIMSTSAIIGTIIITYLAPYFRKFSVYLTNKENPKTYVDYVNACIYKVYATSFANGYFPFFYVAFIKGAFFTYPGDEDVYDYFGLRVDICNVNGCAYALTISLIFFFALKNSTHRLLRAIIPIITDKIKRERAKRRRVQRQRNVATWERDYRLKKAGDLFMLGLFMGVTMHYGYVLFFIAALQLTPMMALLTSIVNLRIDAIHILKNFRRPVAKQLPGIGAWNNIFQIMTYIGTASVCDCIHFRFMAKRNLSTFPFEPYRIYK